MFPILFGAILWRNSVSAPGRPPDAVYPAVAFCVLLGVALILVVIAFSIQREEFHNRGDQLVVGYGLFNRLTRQKFLDKRAIEEITVKPSPGTTAGHHLFMRVPHRLLHLGRTISLEEQPWLRATLLSWLRD